MSNDLLLLELLTSLLQTSYGTLSLHIGLFHFVVNSRHLHKFSLETFQVIVSFPIELIKFNIFLLWVFNFPNNMFCLFQLVG
jgi:hypothetical protein